MAFFQKTNRQNYDFLQGFSWYIPGVPGMFILLLWLFFGMIIGALVTAICTGAGIPTEYSLLVSYPVQFLPAMFFAKAQSSRNFLFEEGVNLSSRNFRPIGGFFLALWCIAATLACTVILDWITSFMPPMPASLENALEYLTKGNLWANLLCVGVFAPLFEEWLCRGMVLRGLLNTTRTDSEGTPVKGLRPVWAIIISSAFFALIHLNPWQAVPAFLIGCLMGYIYYRTGSLWLTILIHAINNSLSVLILNLDLFDGKETLMDVLSPGAFYGAFALSGALIVLFILTLKRIPLKSPQGNCDIIPVPEAEEIQ